MSALLSSPTVRRTVHVYRVQTGYAWLPAAYFPVFVRCTLLRHVFIEVLDLCCSYRNKCSYIGHLSTHNPCTYIGTHTEYNDPIVDWSKYDLNVSFFFF